MKSVFCVFGAILIAWSSGKLISKIKLPSILGWLLTGMIFGPYLLGLIDNSIMNSSIYKYFINALECLAGIMIGAEINFKKLKSFGKKLFIITLFQSLGTFVVVSLFFLIACLLMHLPIYLAFIFGGIALATAPAPALSIVNEYHTDGPVTRTLLPMAALDDVVGLIVFFLVMTITSSALHTKSASFGVVLLTVLLPFIIGIVVAIVSSLIIKKIKSERVAFCVWVAGLLLCIGFGILFEAVILSGESLNFLFMGMTYAMICVNMIKPEVFEKIIHSYSPIQSFSLMVVILNLGLPLDYHAIAGAGLFTFIYIFSRAIGKIGGAYVGSTVMKADPMVKKYLGFTLLPHSGVSLIFTGIAVGMLTGVNNEVAVLIQGTIAAAAIINEIIAVILAKLAFGWAKEIPLKDETSKTTTFE